MTTPKASAQDVMQGRGESDAQDWNDEQIPVEPYREIGPDPERQAEMEAEVRGAEDLLLGLRQLQGGEEIRWSIHRVGDMDDTRNGFLIECATTQLTQSWIRDRFGGGTYRIRGHYPNGRYAAQRTIRIAYDAQKQDVTGRQSENAATNGIGFNLQEFLAQQEARDDRRRDEERERRRYEEEREEKRRRERMELIAAVATPAASVLAALLGNKGPDLGALLTAIKPEPGPSITDMIQAMAAMKQLEPAPAQPAPDAIDKAMQLLEFIKDRAPGGEGETGWMDIAREAVKALGPSVGQAIEGVIQTAQTRAIAEQSRAGVAGAPATSASPEPGRVALPRMNPNASAAPMPATMPGGSPATGTVAGAAGAHFDPTSNGDDVNPMQMMKLIPWLRAQCETLVRKAARNGDPELAAANLLEDAEADHVDLKMIADFVMRSDWLAMIQSFDPRAASFVPWLTQLRNELLQYIAEAQQSESVEPVAGVHTPAGTDPATGREVIHVTGPAEEEGAGDERESVTVDMPPGPKPL